MNRLTVKDLHRMKAEGKKIAAAVVYDYHVARICQFAGANLLSVGDSLGKNVLGQAETDDCTVDDMITFARSVALARDRQAALDMPERPGAVVNVDMPTVPSRSGPKEVEKAARRFKEEARVDICKIDIRTREAELMDQVHAVMAGGLAVYPQIGFDYVFGGELHGSPEERDHVMKWAHALEEAGASMIDLTMVSREVYRDVSRSVKIPVIGGQATSEADGKIQVSFNLVGLGAGNLEGTDANPARDLFNKYKKIIDGIHAGQW
ncbi:MAG: hypothetical protein GTO40_21405 [Deltaproteobacteria bacterium]|nr:hypothetical protein [Deltaproteobacteria bacterium]